ncbi:MAG: hypothetical protein H0W90_03300 [Actinobacteria bacterium]|nr:hypothetical protein [Actinomycetota bacterium]
MDRGLALAALLVGAVALAGCGGETKQAAQVTTAEVTTYPVETVEVQRDQPRHCKGLSKAKQAAQRRRLERDLQRLRVVIKTIKRQAEYGNPAVNKALDQFERDITEEALPIHQRARYIDLAAAIVAPRCYWCFEVLESNRPIAGGGKLACG